MSESLLHDRPGFMVRRIFVSEMNNAVYLLTAKASGEQILIDAADDLAALRGLLREASSDVNVVPRLAWILTTHAHWDHTRAVAELAAETGARIAIGRDDAAQLRDDRGVTADLELVGGEHISVGGTGVDGIDLEVIALRGHTPGSMAFATDGHTLLFTGDSLFPGGVGNTQKDSTRFDQLFGDVTERLFDRFDDDAIVYPGHGAETTLGAERPFLSAWKSRGW